MILTVLFLRITLHLSHLTFTEAWTFMIPPLFEAVRDPAPGQIVRRKLN